jgi:hypothetical protein
MCRASVSFMDPRFNIPLTDPRLGGELVKDPKFLPINVWYRYCAEEHHKNRPVGTYGPADHESLPVFQWIVDRSWPKPIPPQEAVDLAQPLVVETIQHLESGSLEKALASAKRASGVLFLGSSDWRPGRGQPASMRLNAVRAYTVRKFNPHLKSPKIADMLFLKDGKCPRKIRDKQGVRICGLRKHQYDSPCVNALEIAVNRLLFAMKHDGIPA